MIPSHPIRRRLLGALALCAACSILPFSRAQAMPYPNKVFTDPAVVELANACMDGKPERVAALLQKGADVRAVGKLGMTIPHFALLARANAPQVMKLVLDAGGDPVSLLDNGETLPIYAVSRDNADPEVVRVLLDHGISPSWLPTKEPFTSSSLLIRAETRTIGALAASARAKAPPCRMAGRPKRRVSTPSWGSASRSGVMASSPPRLSTRR